MRFNSKALSSAVMIGKAAMPTSPRIRAQRRPTFTMIEYPVDLHFLCPWLPPSSHKCVSIKKNIAGVNWNSRMNVIGVDEEKNSELDM